MTRYERRKLAIDRAIREQIDGYKAIYKKADEDDRDPTEDERLEIESYLKAIETLKQEKTSVEENIKTLQKVDDYGRELGPALGATSVVSEPHDRLIQRMNENVFPQAQKTIGEAFIESEGYRKSVQQYKATGQLPQNWSSGLVQMQTKGTLGELGGVADATRGPIGGGAFVSVPQVVPGVVDKLFQPLRLADLILSGVADSPSVRYVVEGTATSGAAGIPEGGTKLESTLGLTTTDESIKKIATLLPVSEEMLEDGPAIQSYINGRLSLFIRIEEERQLFRGTASSAEVQGFFTSRSVPVFAGGTTDNKAEQVFKALNSMRGSAFIEPEWIAMHPTDYQIIRLLKDTANQYYGGGPFLGPYGGPQGPTGASGQIEGPQDQLWNKPVYVTAAVGGAGTALIGTRANAQVWRRGGLSVEATNSHGSYFALNLVAIRAEERLGLAVYRPAGYCEVRLAVGTGG